VTKHTQALLLTSLALPTAFALTPARADDEGLVWGKAVDGFHMAISLDSTRRLPSGAPVLRLHLGNTGHSGRNNWVNLDCDDSPVGIHSDPVTLVLKDPEGKSQRLVGTRLCSGRRSQFAVVLPPGAIYSVPLDVDYYQAVRESKKLRGPRSPDTYTLQAAMVVDPGQEVEALTSNALVLSGSNFAGKDHEELDWGEAVNGLQMAISQGPTADGPSHLPAITLHVRDVGDNDLRVALGMGCAVIEELDANGVVLNLKDSSGSTRQLTNLGPGPPYPGGCAGGAWMFLVPMIPGALYSVPLRLQYYKRLTFPLMNGDFQRGWEPGGTYTLQASLKLDPEHVNLPPGAIDRRFGEPWAGIVASQGLEVRFPTQ